MKKLAIAGVLAFLANSLESQRHHDRNELTQHQGVSNDCCLANGGTLCGKVSKDCCQNGCEKGYFGTEWCKGRVNYTPNCETCINVCKAKGGSPCSISVSTGKIICCPADKCTKKESDAVNKVKSLASSLLTKFLSHEQQQQAHDQALITGLAQQVAGDKSTCSAGTEIDLGSCIKDHYLDLAKERLSI